MGSGPFSGLCPGCLSVLTPTLDMLIPGPGIVSWGERRKDVDMPSRKASAIWQGDLSKGKGTMKLGSGAYEGKYSFQTRMGDTPGTNPEELIGAALAGCFSMALAHALSQAGAEPVSVETRAQVHFEQKAGDWGISRIDLVTEVEAPGLDEKRFHAIAEATRTHCPVSKALAATEIRLEARLTARA